MSGVVSTLEGAYIDLANGKIAPADFKATLISRINQSDTVSDEDKLLCIQRIEDCDEEGWLFTYVGLNSNNSDRV